VEALAQSPTPPPTCLVCSHAGPGCAWVPAAACSRSHQGPGTGTGLSPDLWSFRPVPSPQNPFLSCQIPRTCSPRCRYVCEQKKKNRKKIKRNCNYFFMEKPHKIQKRSQNVTEAESHRNHNKSAEFYQELLLILFIQTCIPDRQFCSKPGKSSYEALNYHLDPT